MTFWPGLGGEIRGWGEKLQVALPGVEKELSMLRVSFRKLSVEVWGWRVQRRKSRGYCRWMEGMAEEQESVDEGPSKVPLQSI